MIFKVYDIETEDIADPKTDKLECCGCESCEVEANSSYDAAQKFIESACDDYEDGARGKLLVVAPSVTKKGERREVYSFRYEIRVRYNLRLAP